MEPDTRTHASKAMWRIWIIRQAVWIWFVWLTARGSSSTTTSVHVRGLLWVLLNIIYLVNPGWINYMWRSCELRMVRINVRCLQLMLARMLSIKSYICLQMSVALHQTPILQVQLRTYRLSSRWVLKYYILVTVAFKFKITLRNVLVIVLGVNRGMNVVSVKHIQPSYLRTCSHDFQLTSVALDIPRANRGDFLGSLRPVAILRWGSKSQSYPNPPSSWAPSVPKTPNAPCRSS